MLNTTNMETKKIKNFRKTLRAFEREIMLQNNTNLCFGVTIAQCHILLEIEKLGETKVGDLASNISLDKSTVSRTIDGLVSVGLVNRSIPPHNRRSSLIKLTKQGGNICKQINDSNNDYFKKVLSVLDGKELDVFLQNFEKITNNIKEINNSLHNNQ